MPGGVGGNESGYDAVHTSDLPDGNRSTDTWIAWFADSDGRVVVTKDRVIVTGNITNAALLALFRENLDAVVAALESADFVELGSTALVVHRRRADES